MFWRNQTIEDLAEQRLSEFGRMTGWTPAPPVPVEQVAEHLFDLSILWETIEAPKGLKIWGGLRVADKQIVMNEEHVVLFHDKPGLERFTMAHEIGHWDLTEARRHVALHNQLPGLDMESLDLKCRDGGVVRVIKADWNDVASREAHATYKRLVDQPDERRPVDRYAGALLIPKSLLFPAIEGLDLSTWKNLYPVANRFRVTISALRVRLEQLNKIHVDEKGSIFVGTKEENAGQQKLPI